jgi:hypothetical protein
MRHKAGKRRAAQPLASVGRSTTKRVKVAARRRNTLDIVPKIEDTGIPVGLEMAQQRPSPMGTVEAEDEGSAFYDASGQTVSQLPVAGSTGLPYTGFGSSAPLYHS